MANIVWTASTTDNWIILNGEGQRITGEGDTEINVEITPSPPGGEAMIGTITFTSEGGHYVKKVQVQRCASDCDCDMVRPDKDSITFVWSATSEVKEVEVISIPECAAGKVEITIDDSENFITAFTESSYTIKPKGENRTEAPFTTKVHINYSECTESVVNVTQGINGCSCADIEVTEGPIIFNYNETSTWKEFIRLLNIDCFELREKEDVGEGEHKFKFGDFTIEVIYPQSVYYAELNWFDNITIDSNNLCVKPKEENQDEADKTCTIQITDNKGVCKNIPPISVRQNGNTPCRPYTFTTKVLEGDVTPEGNLTCKGGTVEFKAIQDNN